MQKYFTLALVAIIGLASCTKDRVVPAATNSNSITIPDTAAYIVANEFVAVENANSWTNEFGKQADWIELYNPSSFDMDFTKDSIYVTDAVMSDTIHASDKYLLTQFKIPSHQFLIICCDDSNKVVTQIHTGFGLSKSGEFVGVYKKNKNGTYTTWTAHPFGVQTAGFSEGQKPDNSNNWQQLTPSPGKSNN